MDEHQLKLKIDYLILKCNILENDIFTEQQSYYKWILVKVKAKIAQMNSAYNVLTNTFVIVLAVGALISSIISLLVATNGNESLTIISKAMIILLCLMLFLVAFMVVKGYMKVTSSKEIKRRENLYYLHELLNEYVK